MGLMPATSWPQILRVARGFRQDPPVLRHRVRHPGHESFSKRHMAALLVSTMAIMGHKSVMGHDRGARVAYRMALDHPAAIRSVVIIEIIPTSDMWDAFNASMAMKAYHWSFLAQPFPVPERLIGSDPVFYLDWTLRSWTKGNSLESFDLRALESYRQQIREPARVQIAPFAGKI